VNVHFSPEAAAEIEWEEGEEAAAREAGWPYWDMDVAMAFSHRWHHDRKESKS
jgi:hypothetical protein